MANGSVEKVSKNGKYAIIDTGVVGKRYGLAKRKEAPQGLLGEGSGEGAFSPHFPDNWDLVSVTTSAHDPQALDEITAVLDDLP